MPKDRRWLDRKLDELAALLRKLPRARRSAFNRELQATVRRPVPQKNKPR